MSEKNDTPNRWQWHPDRWDSAEQASEAHVKFLHGATALIGRGRGNPSVWTEVESLGMRLMTHVGLIFHGVPGRWAAAALREALERFDREPTMMERRAYCVEEIAEAGEDWKRPEWQASDETRKRRLGALAGNLGFYDAKLAASFPTDDDANLSVLAERIATFDAEPAGKRGAKGAERILAEIIVLNVGSGALGFDVDEDTDDVEGEIDRVRRALNKSITDLFSRANPAEKPP